MNTKPNPTKIQLYQQLLIGWDLHMNTTDIIYGDVLKISQSIQFLKYGQIYHISFYFYLGSFGRAKNFTSFPRNDYEQLLMLSVFVRYYILSITQTRRSKVNNIKRTLKSAHPIFRTINICRYPFGAIIYSTKVARKVNLLRFPHTRLIISAAAGNGVVCIWLFQAGPSTGRAAHKTVGQARQRC